MSQVTQLEGTPLEGIAIVGMAGRFPGAPDLEAYWRLLRDGVEAIRHFSHEELLEAGIEAEVLALPNYVRAAGVLDGADLFDAEHFAFTPREAELLDPQYRLFLETAWHALEHAGYDSERYRGAIGLFGGMTLGAYLPRNIAANPRVARAAGDLQLRILNDKDFLASLTAYKLNLRGPSVTVQTACSTSLVATALACQSLVAYQCDLALAGGVCLSVPLYSGYFAHDSVFSPDGRCRAFDAGAAGTVAGAGVGMVVLKRLEDALAEGDTIHAVVRGWAINNDGSAKVGYTAPSIDGQAEVIAMAQAMAGVEAASIGYVETHGTATPLGDEIEVAALSQVFRETTDEVGFCGLGSVKTNIGHLDTAAGAASLIKTVLALEHGELPPSLNFERPSPRLELATSPFYVNAALRPWPRRAEQPRRAGVSAFAVGGVNAHLVLEEAPPAETTAPARPWQLLTLSARTPSALERATEQLAAHLEAAPGVELADVAHTLLTGRRAWPHRRALVATSTAEAAALLGARDPKRLLGGVCEQRGREVAFLFPGLGNHYVGMGRELYQAEPVFRATIDRGAELLRAELGFDLRTKLYPQGTVAPAAEGLDLRRMLGRRAADAEADAAPAGAAGELLQTEIAQPALFLVELALAELWQSWGVRPKALFGYSLGELVAATVAGVFRVEDALVLVARRARLIQRLPQGAMLAIPLAEAAVEPLLEAELSVTANIGPELVVVGGPEAPVAALATRLEAQGVSFRRLETAHVFHSPMMRPVTAAFAEMVAAFERRPPQVPFLSDVTGTWITDAEAVDPAYWARHLEQPVRCAEALGELGRSGERVLLEVGPGQVLGSWALQLPTSGARPTVVASMRHAYEGSPDGAVLAGALGRLWLAGVEVDGAALHGEGRKRVPLPLYPFERRRYWVEPESSVASGLVASGWGAERVAAHEGVASGLPVRNPADRWLYRPVWREEPPVAALGSPAHGPSSGRWLVVADERLAPALAEELERRGHAVALALPAARFARVAAGAYLLEPLDPAGWSALLADVESAGPPLARLVWAAGLEAAAAPPERSFLALAALAQALGEGMRRAPLEVTLLSAGACAVSGAEDGCAEAALLAGPALVLPQELPAASTRWLDCLVPPSEPARAALAAQVVDELLGAAPAGGVVALRGGRRWVRGFEPLALPVSRSSRGLAVADGVYVLTGGLGGLGLAVARELHRALGARLVLVGRSSLPPREEWQARLAEGGGRGRRDHGRLGRRLAALLELEAAGAEILVLTADVTDRSALEAVRAATLARFGRLDVVLHAAGVMPGGLLQRLSAERAQEVLAPKVAGTRAVVEVLGEGARGVVLFSSLTALTGALGLADHTAANAFLDAFAESRPPGARPRVVSVAWDSWLEVGQAAEAAASFGLTAGEDEPGQPAAHPLLGLRRDEEGGARFRQRISTAAHWPVAEHRLAGVGLMPGTGYLEMARAALAELVGEGPVSFERVSFLEPLLVRDGDEVTVETVLTPATEGYRFEVRSHRAGDGWRSHARGAVHEPSAASAPPVRAMLEAELPEVAVPAAATDAGSAEGIGFGPRWRGILQRLWVGGEEARAELLLGEDFEQDLETYVLHPALLDAATGLVGLLGDGSTYLPLEYERLELLRPLPRRLLVEARFGQGEAPRSAAAEVVSCGLRLFDGAGELLVEVPSLTLRRVGEVARLVEPAGGSDQAPPALDGLSPAEGAATLLRLLRAEALPAHVAVSTHPLAAVLQAARASTHGAAEHAEAATEIRRAGRGLAPRPDLATAFVAPRTELEEGVAQLFTEILGIEGVGAFDNFFDLGADSLSATRLIGRAEEVFDVQLSLKTVFERPSPAELAVAVVERQAARTETQDLEALLAEIGSLSPDEVRAAMAAGVPEEREP